MTILEIKQYFEQVFQIIKKAGTVEEQQKAIALNEQLGKLYIENETLRAENAELKRELDLSEKIQRTERTFFTLVGTPPTVRFCTACWDSSKKTIQLNCEDGSYSCPICENHGFYDRELADRRSQEDIESFQVVY